LDVDEGLAEQILADVDKEELESRARVCFMYFLLFKYLLFRRKLRKQQKD
jgi:hypothetical protein